jgi:hypothetical protein
MALVEAVVTLVSADSNDQPLRGSRTRCAPHPGQESDDRESAKGLQRTSRGGVRGRFYPSQVRLAYSDLSRLTFSPS